MPLCVTTLSRLMHLNMLSGILPLDLQADAERDYTSFSHWDKTYDGQLRPDMVEL